MSYIHAKNIFHCEFSCRNVFVFDDLFSDWVVKIGDFGCSSLDHREPLGAEEVRYELPLRGREWAEREYIKRELFALGCGIYEIMAWKMPFAELTVAEVDYNYRREVFPDVGGLLAGDDIRGCWMEKFETADAVEAASKEGLEGAWTWSLQEATRILAHRIQILCN